MGGCVSTLKPSHQCAGQLFSPPLPFKTSLVMQLKIKWNQKKFWAVWLSRSLSYDSHLPSQVQWVKLSSIKHSELINKSRGVLATIALLNWRFRLECWWELYILCLYVIGFFLFFFGQAQPHKQKTVANYELVKGHCGHSTGVPLCFSLIQKPVIVWISALSHKCSVWCRCVEASKLLLVFSWAEFVLVQTCSA